MRALVVCSLVVALARTAWAQPTPETIQRAAALYDQGKRHFDIAEYGPAIAAWKEAYLLSSEPLLLFNIAQAHRLAGDCGQANRFYLNYKRLQPKPPNQAELDSAMSKCAGIPPAGDSGAEPPEPPPAEPIPPVVPARGTIETDQGKRLRLYGYLTGGAGIVLGGVAIGYAFSARSHAADISGQPAGTPWDAALARTERDGQSAQTRARVLGVVGVAAIVAGGGLWWYGHGKSAVKVEVAITPHHAQAGLSCAF